MADMMLDGTLCAGCGTYDPNLEDTGGPALCADCKADPETAKAWGHTTKKKRRSKEASDA